MAGRRKGRVETATYQELKRLGLLEASALGTWALEIARSIDEPTTKTVPVQVHVKCPHCEHEHEVSSTASVPTIEARDRAGMGRELRMTMKQLTSADGVGADEPDAGYAQPV